MFQIKDFRSIVASMINWMRSTQTKITDFNVGSVARTLVEAPAAELDEYYQQMFFGIKEAIPVSVYHSFDFARIEAVAASGLVRVTVTPGANPILIQSGTIFTASGGSTTYVSTDDAIINPGDSVVDVLVAATQPGTIGNIGAGQSFTLSPPPEGFVSATNLSPFMNGINQETDEDRKLRFNAYIQSLSRGTVAALEYGLKTTQLLDPGGNLIERVVSVSIVEPYKDIDPSMPIAWVQCYVHNGVGNTTSALVNRARDVVYGYYDEHGNAVPGWKAAGVKVDVHPANEQDLDVDGVLTALPGYDHATLVNRATESIFAYLQGLEIGDPAILSEIIARVMEIDGVYNFVPSTPTADVAVDKTTKIMPGNITIA